VTLFALSFFSWHPTRDLLVLVLSVNKVLACIGVLGLVLPLVGNSPFIEGSALLLDSTDSRMSA
jgi:uncharacterized membrane protein YbaN (DUF454 family)